jgi:hypothetical protein
MAIIEQANPYLQLKQRTNRDIRQLGPVVTQYYEADSTAGQTQINLSFAVEQTDVAKKQIQLFVDGKFLREGSSNDYTYIGAINGQSSQIQLSVPLAAGLNIAAYKIGASIPTFLTPDVVQATLNNDVAQPNAMAAAGFNNFIAPVYKAVTNTAIINRAQVIDETATLKSIAGIERLTIREINLLQNEFGVSGERVYEPDSKDSRIRMVGVWSQNSSAIGANAFTIDTASYVEVHFYGTGLNIVWFATGTPFDLRATVDGGAEGANFTSSTYSSVLNNRSYSTNQVTSVVSGLSLGWHTVKVRNNSGSAGVNLYGFEILNERTTLATLPGTAFNGTKREILNALSSSAFGAGVAGARGARVVKYIQNGVISQVVQEVNASAAFLTSADHTNEDVIRRVNFRDFGSSRADDFVTLAATASDRIFTLDDGTTSLTGSAVKGEPVFGIDSLRANGAAGTNYFTLTFVGTGLDIFTGGDNTSRQLAITVDGSSVGTITVAATAIATLKVCSGLPYGTHTVRFQNPSAVNDSFSVGDFIIYGPKKPSIPSGAIEVADYNVLATYVANATASQESMATGVIRKSALRELNYVGANWAIDTTTAQAYINNRQFFTTTSGQYFEYTFFGTGFELRHKAFTTYSSSVLVTLNGTSLTTANFATAASSGVGYSSGTPLNLTTGVFNSQAASNVSGASLSVRNLPLGKYTVRFTNNAAASFGVEAFDVICPIHINQTSLKIGNSSVNSNRTFSPQKTTVNTLPDLGKAKAWVHFASGIIYASSNVTAVILTSTGQYTVFFDKPFKNALYVGVPTCNSGQAYENIKYPGNYQVTTTNSAGTAVTAGVISIVFFGELVDE